MLVQCYNAGTQSGSAGMGVDLLNVRGLEAIDHQGPIVMVNLMRFRERSLDGNGSGWDAYLRYSALTVPMIKARGGLRYANPPYGFAGTTARVPQNFRTRSGVISARERMPIRARSRPISSCSSVMARSTPACPAATAA